MVDRRPPALKGERHHRPRVRANVTATTSSAPPARSAAAQAARVPPVVATSSTSTMRRGGGPARRRTPPVRPGAAFAPPSADLSGARAVSRARAREAVVHRQARAAGQGVGQQPRLVEAAAPATRRMKRHRHEARFGQQAGRHGGGDLRRHRVGHPHGPTELERPHQLARGAFVGERRPDRDPLRHHRARRKPAQGPAAGHTERLRPPGQTSTPPAERRYDHAPEDPRSRVTRGDSTATIRRQWTTRNCIGSPIRRCSLRWPCSRASTSGAFARCAGRPAGAGPEASRHWPSAARWSPS